jgi:phage gpG-like protein
MGFKNKTKVIKSPKQAIRQLEKLGNNLRGENSVRVGLPKGSNNYPDGTSVIMVGAVHEFGSIGRNIPERSYLRSTLKEHRKKYRRIFRKLSKQIVEGKITKEQALNKIGLIVQTDVRNKIIDLKEPPLKYREGNPLYDSGHLLRSINYQVGDD